MKVDPSRNISFKSSSRHIYYPDGNSFSTYTKFFRSDIEWDKLVKILENKYSGTDRVNIIDHACSTGEEAVSIALRLKSELGETADKKYFPIDARDIDTENIISARRGIFFADKSELMSIVKKTKGDFSKWLKIIRGGNEYKNFVCLKDEMKTAIKFSQSDIFKDVKSIPAENTVLFCRNFWPYLGFDEQKELIKQLSKRLKPSSLVVLGSFDASSFIHQLFEKEGFKHTGSFFIMQKRSPLSLLYNKVINKLALLKSRFF